MGRRTSDVGGIDFGKGYDSQNTRDAGAKGICQ